MSNYKKILVAIDINTSYESIIQKALSVCDNPADMNLIYVTLPTTYIQPYLYGMEYDVVNDGDRVELAEKKLTEIANQFGINKTNAFVKLGIAADEIKDLAHEKDIDLIVMGTHGRSGIKLLLGSTANAVLHGVKQDVLAIKINDD
jgi:universal stress protein A